MATINIGSLSFTHKGDYASGTAYVKNDVVYYSTNGNAYIAKTSTTGNAPTSTAHWDLFAAGSGGIWNAGLSLGSAGQSVKVNDAGNALEFGTISSDFARQIKYTQTSSTYNMSSTSYADTGISLTFDNPLKSTNSLVKITFSFMFGSNNNDNRCFGEYRDAGGSKITNVIGNPNTHWGSGTISSSGHWEWCTNICFATVSSTTPIAYRPFWKRQTGSGYNIWLGRSNDDSTNHPTLFMIEEYAI